MEYFVIIIFLIILVIILKYLFSYNKKQIEEIAKNEELDGIAKKYPDNIDMCKEYLHMLNVKDSFTRIQTIAHECLHSIQDRKILLFNFIYSNIYMLYFITISILKLLNILPHEMVFLVILITGGFVYYFVRSYLEDDAMIKARFLAKEYMENKKISSQEEINKMVQRFDKLNDMGIKSVNYTLWMTVIIEIIIFCGICMIR